MVGSILEGWCLHSTMATPQPTEAQAEELAFEQELAETERSLLALKERYAQVQHAQHTLPELHQQRDRLQRQLKRQPISELKADLDRLQTQLDELEYHLESQLFTWDSLKKPFWQIIRFSGLGIVVGWFLAFAVLQTTPPKAPSPLAPTPSTPNPE